MSRENFLYRICAIMIFCGLTSCTNYKYGSVEEEFLIKSSSVSTIAEAKKWFADNRGVIEKEDLDSFSGSFAIYDEAYVIYKYDFDYTQSQDNADTKISVEAGVKNIEIPGDLVMTDESAIALRAQEMIKKEINSLKFFLSN